MENLKYVTKFQRKWPREFAGVQGGRLFETRANMNRSRPSRFYVETITEADEEEDESVEDENRSTFTRAKLEVKRNIELELRRAKHFWQQIMDQDETDLEGKQANVLEEFLTSRSRTNSTEVPCPILNSSNMRVLKRQTSFGPPPTEFRPRAYTDPTDLLWVCRERGKWLTEYSGQEGVRTFVNSWWPGGEIDYLGSESTQKKSDSTESLSSPDEPERTSKCFSASSGSDTRDMDDERTSVDRPQLTHRISAPCRSAGGRRNSLLQPGAGRRYSMGVPTGARGRMGRRQSEVPALTSLARRRNSQTPAYPVGLKRRGSRGFSNAEFHYSNIRVKAKHEMLANLVLPSIADPSPRIRERRITYAYHPVTKRTKKDEKRLLATKEILVTEKSYLACLSTLKTIFEDPMRESSLLCPKDLDIVFPKELEHIRESHTLFMKELEERIQNWKHYGIVGDIFTKLSSSYHINVLMIYSNYVNNFPKAIAVINKFSRTSHKFRKFLKDCSMDPACAGLDLPAYLLTPIQRLPRYVLLLRQVSKYTDSSHPDGFHLKNALENMTQMINVLNDSIQNSHSIICSSPPRKTQKKRSLRKKASLKELKNKRENNDIVSRITPESKAEVSNTSIDSGYHPTPTGIKTTAEPTQESITSPPSSPITGRSSSMSSSDKQHLVLTRVQSGDRKCRPVSTGDLDRFYESDQMKEFTSIVEERDDKEPKSSTQSKLKMAKETMRRTWQRRSKKWRRSVEEIFSDSKSEGTSVLSELSGDFPSPMENRPESTGISIPPASPKIQVQKSSTDELRDMTVTNPVLKAEENSTAVVSMEETESKNDDELNRCNGILGVDQESVISLDSELSGVTTSPDISPCDTLTRRRKAGQCMQRPISLMLPSQLTADTTKILNSELKTTNSESDMASNSESTENVWVPRPLARPRFTRSSSDGVRHFVMRSRKSSSVSSDRRVSTGSNGSFNESEDSGVSGTPDTSPSNTLRLRSSSNTKPVAGRTLSSPMYLEHQSDKLSRERQRRSWEKLFVSGMEQKDCAIKSDDESEKQRKHNKSRRRFKDVVKQLFTAKRRNSATSIADVVPKTPPPTSPSRRSFAVGEKISTV